MLPLHMYHKVPNTIDYLACSVFPVSESLRLRSAASRTFELTPPQRILLHALQIGIGSIDLTLGDVLLYEI